MKKIKRKRWSKINLLFMLLPFFIICSLLLTWFSYTQLESITKKNGQNFIMQSVELFGQSLTTSISNMEEDVNNLYYSDSLVRFVYHNESSMSFEPQLEHKFDTSSGSMDKIFFLDTVGDIVKGIIYKDNTLNYSYSSEDFKQYLKDDFFKSGDYIKEMGQDPINPVTGDAYYVGKVAYLNIYQTLHDTNGDIIGTFVVPMKLQKFFENFLLSFDLSYDGYPRVQNKNLDYIMHPVTDRIGQSESELRDPDSDISDSKQLEEKKQKYDAGKIEFNSYRVVNGKETSSKRIGAFQWIDIGNDRWLITIDADYNEMTKDIDESKHLLIVLFIFLAIGSVLSIFTLRNLQKKEAIEQENIFLKELQKKQAEIFVIEKQLYEMSKMETIGLLSTSIVHDMNNFLTPIVGNAELLLEELEDDDEARDDVNEILNAALIGQKLAVNLLKNSRSAANEDMKQVHNVDEMMTVAVETVEAIIPESIEFKLKLDEDTGNIRVEPIDLQNIIYNMVKNSIHAIGAHEGHITVGVRFASEEEKDYLVKDKPFPSNISQPILALYIEDDGCGMSEETSQQVFEPFFSTRTQEEGTGLGLFAVASIIAKYDWAIDVDSTIGVGTTFTILIPTVENDES